MERCSICIATYKRPSLLSELLLSLEKQLLPPHVEIETLVVDNDKDGSAYSVCEQFSKSKTLGLTYYRQPRKNISLTRNVAVAHATGTYLFFIDDDEVATPEWVPMMLRAIQTYDADGVLGVVLPEFHPAAPKWMKKAYVFNRPIEPTGKPQTKMSTSNCMVKASLLKSVPGPFDARYGLTGGEDTYLFSTLSRAGAKFVSSREALVTEYIPPERTTLAWMLKRTLRSGNCYIRRKFDFSNKSHLLVRLETLVVSLPYLMACCVLAIAMSPSPHRFLHWLLKGTSNVGRLLAVFGIHIQEY